MTPCPEKAASAVAAAWIDAEWDGRYYLPDTRRQELNLLDKWNKGRDWVSAL